MVTVSSMISSTTDCCVPYTGTDQARPDQVGGRQVAFYSQSGDPIEDARTDDGRGLSALFGAGDASGDQSAQAAPSAATRVVLAG